MAEAQKLYEVDLTDVRLSWARLHTPESSIEGGKPKYSAEFIIDPNTANGKKSIEAAKKALNEILADTWKDKGVNIYKNLEKNRKAFRAGETFTDSNGEVGEQYAGKMVIKASRHTEQGRPLVLSRRAQPMQAGDEGYPYNGCYVNATIRFYAVSDQARGGNGVFASVEVVQYFRKGEAFGGGAPAVDYESKFKDLGDEDESDESSSSSSASDDDGGDPLG